MIKLVYVCVGTEKTEYLNMLRISLASARKYMPDIAIEVVTDTDTARTMTENGTLAQYRVGIIPVTIDGAYNTVEKSRYLKTNLRSVVDGDFLYLDTDTIICEDISGVEPEGSVNMVLDEHGLLNEQEEQGAAIRRQGLKRGIDLSDCERYYNGGVLLAKDDETARLFFKKWFEKWDATRQPELHHDQYSLNAVAMETGAVHELDGTWNCQLTANDRAFYYLRNVKILHYLSLQPAGIYRLNCKSELDDLTDDLIEEIITSPEKQFRKFYFYAEDSTEYQIMQQSHFHLVYRLYTRHPKLYRFGEKLLSKLRK